MKRILQEKIRDQFEQPVFNARDCELLSREIHSQTGRSISSTTLRRFFGLLSSKSELSGYNMDTLAIFCGSSSYPAFCEKFDRLSALPDQDFVETIREMEQVTSYTLTGISRRSLTPFAGTIPRKSANTNLDYFLSSDYTLFPFIAPGGYGKSIALAHWVLEHQSRNGNPNFFLFFQASMLSQLLVQGRQTSRRMNLNLADSKNLIQLFPLEFRKEKRRLVLVIDGIDEPENHTKGILQLAAFIKNAAAQFHPAGFLKIVLAVREVSWNKFLMPEFIAGKPPWLLHSGVDRLESGSSNLQVLDNNEVKEILLLHNEKQNPPVIYDCIDWRMRELIRIPLNLYVFTSLVARAIPLSELTPDLLLLEYINTIVFKTRFAEEKTDILWKLVELTLENKSGFAVRKNSLKEVYPIHLKKESNYFPAYQDLISMGILNEKQTENKYGLMVGQVEFRHTNFYYYIAALYLVDRHEKIDNALFKKIIKFSMGIQWTANVVSYVFQLAFSREDYDALKDFCQLDKSVLSSLPVRHTVGIAFRQANRIRIPLIERFASHPMGRIYYFEQFVDTNYIFNNYEYRIRSYLEHQGGKEALLFGHCILYLADFLRMNIHGCAKNREEILKIVPEEGIHPWPIGRMVSTTIFHRYIVTDDPIPDLNAFIDQNRKIAYRYESYLANGLIEFEMSIMVALVLIEEYDILVRLVRNAYEKYSLINPAHQGFTWIHQHQNKMVDIFIDYARFKINGAPGKETVKDCEHFLNSYVSFFDDFQYLILINLFLVEYYTFEKNEKKAGWYFHNALELARHAKYTFYEAYLLKRFSHFNKQYGDAAAKLIEVSQFNGGSVCFAD